MNGRSDSNHQNTTPVVVTNAFQYNDWLTGGDDVGFGKIPVLDGSGNPTNFNKVNPEFVQLLQRIKAAQKVRQDSSDLKFTYGIQAGVRVGLTKLLGGKFDFDMGSREMSLITGKEYVNENYTVYIDIAGFSFGFDASRNTEISNFVYGQDSIHGILSGQPFEFSPAFQTPWGVSSQEFWQIDFGASFMLGIEGKLDFD